MHKDFLMTRRSIPYMKKTCLNCSLPNLKHKHDIANHSSKKMKVIEPPRWYAPPVLINQVICHTSEFHATQLLQSIFSFNGKFGEIVLRRQMSSNSQLKL